MVWLQAQLHMQVISDVEAEVEVGECMYPMVLGVYRRILDLRERSQGISCAAAGVDQWRYDGGSKR